MPSSSAAPSTRPGPGSWAKMMSRTLLGSVPGLSGFKLAAEIFSLLEPANLGQVLHHRNVGQMFPAIFTVQDLRLRMIESDDLVQIGVAVYGIPLNFHLHANHV